MSRELIYSLVLSVLMVTAPHAPHLPVWTSALGATLLIWRSYLAYSGRPLPGRSALLAITIASLFAILFEFHTLFGREVGITLLGLLASLKLLEIRNRRDAMALIYLCCFSIIVNFFYSQSLATGFYLIATLLVITVSWVHLNMPASAFKPRLKVASTLLLQALPLTLILFLLFPRIQGPLWGLPQDAYSSKSGLDDKMSPGSMAHLILSDDVAFRVRYKGHVPRRDQMYWRGPVLWDFNGTTWVRGKAGDVVPPLLSDASDPVEYEVTLEPNDKNWLFALDMPDGITVPARLTYDFQAISPKPIHERIIYDARSELSYRANLHESDAQLARALRLPPNIDPKTIALAREWRAQSSSDEQVIGHALAYFHNQNFRYTLEPRPSGSIDEFLFSTREGYCEHYASGFVFLMRAAGIPARVVTGYQGGEYNSIGRYYIVRQSDAHAWAEVWLKGSGWRRVDPTAAISPERVERGLSTVQSPGLAISEGAAWLHGLRMNWDALSYQWNQWVIGYNSENQQAYLSRMGLTSAAQRIAYLALILGFIVLLFALYMLRFLFMKKTDRAQRAWLRVCRKLERAGLPRLQHEGPQDYAMRVAASRPDLSFNIHEIADLYIQLRYADSKEDKARLDRLSSAFRP